jgi:DNA invertase Pin-like site-specific DNA recombinase
VVQRRLVTVNLRRPERSEDHRVSVSGVLRRPWRSELALSGTSTRQQRPGVAALLDYARQGDAIVVVGIDRLGRNAAEVMTTIRDLGERGIVLRSLREGIDTSNASGRMVAGVLASLAELELELGRERRTAARDLRRARSQSIGRPKALDSSKAALAKRMHANGGKHDSCYARRESRNGVPRAGKLCGIAARLAGERSIDLLGVVWQLALLRQDLAQILLHLRR